LRVDHPPSRLQWKAYMAKGASSHRRPLRKNNRNPYFPNLLIKAGEAVSSFCGTERPDMVGHLLPG